MAEYPPLSSDRESPPSDMLAHVHPSDVLADTTLSPARKRAVLKYWARRLGRAGGGARQEQLRTAIDAALERLD